MLHETFGELDLSYPPADFDVGRERARLAREPAGGKTTR